VYTPADKQCRRRVTELVDEECKPKTAEQDYGGDNEAREQSRPNDVRNAHENRQKDEERDRPDDASPEFSIAASVIDGGGVLRHDCPPLAHSLARGSKAPAEQN
jgi:hypothetical protein